MIPPIARFLPALLLAGCAAGTDPLAVDEEGAARAAETPPDLAAVAQALDARRGQQLTGDLTILGAEAEGRQLAMRFRDARAADEFGAADRELYAIEGNRQIRDQMCAQPATRRFVEEYDGVSAEIVSADGAQLARVEIEDC